jgi:hypothetical protein
VCCSLTIRTDRRRAPDCSYRFPERSQLDRSVGSREDSTADEQKRGRIEEVQPQMTPMDADEEDGIPDHFTDFFNSSALICVICG